MSPAPYTSSNSSATSASSTRSTSSTSSTSSATSKVLWEDVPTEFTKRGACVLIYGLTDSGKSTLALTAPGPIAYIHSYEKLGGIIEVARQEKMIRQVKFGGLLRGSSDRVQELADAEFTKLENAVSDAYKWARTIVLDTETYAWELVQLARLGSLERADRSEKDNKKGQLVYTGINNRWVTMRNEFRLRLDNPLQDKHTNLILIAKTKEEYKKGSDGKQFATGKHIRAGHKDTAFFADVVLRTKIDRERGEDVFKCVVEKPWMNTWMRGEEIYGESLSFGGIMELLTGVDASEWS